MVLFNKIIKKTTTLDLFCCLINNYRISNVSFKLWLHDPSLAALLLIPLKICNDPQRGHLAHFGKLWVRLSKVIIFKIKLYFWCPLTITWHNLLSIVKCATYNRYLVLYKVTCNQKYKDKFWLNGLIKL